MADLKVWEDRVDEWEQRALKVSAPRRDEEVGGRSPGHCNMHDSRRGCRNYGQAEGDAARLKKENEALRLAATSGTAQPPPPPQQPPPPIAASYDSYATSYTSTTSTSTSTLEPDAGKPKLLARIMVTLPA